MTVTVTLEGNPTWSRQRNVGHYGGASDKANSKIEGRVPLAWVFYRELRAGRGSAYATVYEGTKEGLVHAENLAIARSEAVRFRAANKLYNNALPATSDEKLESWIRSLGVSSRVGDTRQDLRLRCAAKYRASVGPTDSNIRDVCQELLGDAFVRVWVLKGTNLDNPPTPTYWPGVNPGPVAYDLGGGTWLSVRDHLIVETTQPEGMEQLDYLLLVNIYLFELLDRLLPAWATFDWAEGLTAGGFVLGVDELDYTGLG